MASVVVNNTLFTGKFLIHEPTLSSTNEFAKNFITKTNPTHGTVIITDSQVSGKGQGSNHWASEAGQNITCSIIYDTGFLPVAKQYFLNMAVAVAVRQTAAHFVDGLDVAIKWPNDILCNDGKIAGILIENTLQGRSLKHSIIGIGLNVNQTKFDGLPQAASLATLKGTTFPLGEVLDKLCFFAEQQFLKIKGGRFEEVRASYNSHLYRKGQLTRWQFGQNILRGIPLEVLPDGRLEISVDDRPIQVRFGEVRWLPDDFGND